VYWNFVTIALIVMRIDERRVSIGKSTLWRAMLGKGPKLPKERNGVVVESLDNPVVEDNSKKGAITRVDREVQNLLV
jgi:hypothetical protein